MNVPLRVGLAGAGMVSTYHLPAWRAVGDAVVLSAIADPDVARAQACADEYRIPCVYPSLADMLRHESLDAVDLMTPPALHVAHCLEAARSGVAILCQKPLAPSWHEAAALVRELPPGVRLMIHENWRFRPHYRQVAQWLADGRIGELRSGRLQVASSGLLPTPEGVRPALARQPLLATLPKLMIAEVLVHHLDVALWLTGADRLLAASTRHAVPDVPGESAAWLQLQGSDGLQIDVAGDMADPTAPPGLRDLLFLSGTRGDIQLADEGLRLQSDALSRRVPVDFEKDYRASYAAAIAHFVHGLRIGAPFETSPEAHLRVLSLVDQAYTMSTRPSPGAR